jgi:putative hydrolase of the HAD superfamily
MKFYRRLSPIKAISFDLDDTLYANHPVMLSAEAKMIDYFSEHFVDVLQGKLKGVVLNQKFWSIAKTQAITTKAWLADDVVGLRLESYYLGILSLGYNQQQAKGKAQQAMDYFAVVRSQFTVPEISHQLLKQLAEVYPLVAISNGNVDTKAIGIAHYFQHIFHATGGVKQKPHGQMFELTCAKLSIAPEQLLHVGDCGRADIQGAIAAGCQSAWLPRYNIGKPVMVLPSIELLAVEELAQLLLP